MDIKHYIKKPIKKYGDNFKVYLIVGIGLTIVGYIAMIIAYDILGLKVVYTQPIFIVFRFTDGLSHSWFSLLQLSGITLTR